MLHCQTGNDCDLAFAGISCHTASEVNFHCGRGPGHCSTDSQRICVTQG